MRKGQCPKCGSSNVFTKKDGINYGAFEIVISFLVTHSPANDYICTDCGYFERYIDDQPKLAEIAQKWRKVK